MPNLKDIRKRIDSVKSTQKITRAMKMIAAARLRRAQDAIMNTRPYAYRIDGLIKGLSEVLDAYQHPMMIPREEVKKVGLIVLTGDRGLCGAFNGSILRTTDARLAKEWAGKDVELSLIGRRAIDYYKKRSVNVAHIYPDAYTGESRFEEADAISRQVSHDFENGKIDELWVLYNEFKSAISQKVVLEKLVPIVPAEDAEAVIYKEYLYEPERKDILNDLVPQHLSIQIYRCLLESSASEHAARMTAMDGATRNAGEMIDRLTLKYNRARQAAITTELMEIIGGAEALKG